MSQPPPMMIGGGPPGGGAPGGPPKAPPPPAKTPPKPQGQQQQQPKKRGCLLPAIAGTVFVIILFLLGVTFFAPVQLAQPQEQLMGLLHGGIADAQSQTFVDGCVQTEEGPRAIRRTRREVRFNDGAILVMVFSEPPQTTTC